MEAAKNLIWLVLFLPLVGSLVQALFGGKIVKQLGPKKGKWLMGLLAVAPILIAFAIGAFITLQLTKAEPQDRHFVVELFNWIDFTSIRIPFETLIDPLSMTMVLIITGIGALIHLYATGYMAEEKEYTRFFTYLNLFVAAMLILVLGNNLAMLFIGWEGVGVCSYLLIGFWYKDISNAKAANKAFIVNRIGDWGLTLGIFMLVSLVLTKTLAGPGDDNRWLSYDVLLPIMMQSLSDNAGVATAIALLFFVGACGKSAQFPLYLWLPDAMAGPTPVSALIHAATMVTSGVFLLNRMNLLFQLAPTASAIVAAVGAFTAVFAAIIAFGQMDIKKVLAYSTVSQLGLMFVGCGAGYFWAGMFHVTTHAFFKALLFLGSGAVIHAMSHNQDMRNYGGLFKYIKITASCMIIGWLAISGFYWGSGWFSKSAIVDGAIAQDYSLFNGNQNFGLYAGYFGLFASFLTAIYMTRMTWLTFFNKEERWRAIEPAHHADHAEHPAHAAHEAHDHGSDEHGFFLAEAPHEEHEHHHELDKNHTPHEVPISMWLPLVVLAICSIFAGWLMGRPIHIEGAPEGQHIAVFQNWLYPNGLSQWYQLPSGPEDHTMILTVSLAAVFGGLFLGGFWYFARNKNLLPMSEGWDLAKWNPWRRRALNQFGYDDAMVNSAVEGGDQLAVALWKKVDVGVIDRIVNGMGGLVGGVGKVFAWFQGGQVRGYALMMLAGVALLLGYVAFKMKEREAPPVEHVEMAQEVVQR
ncbi:MAG: NADH-quinone oxidoreductase subunit L [Fimbriimonadaceae bacterium]